MRASFKSLATFFATLAVHVSFSQTNLLLNSGFEDINTCTEYKSECGVEGCFYLKEVKVQMLLNENNINLVGANSYNIYYNWTGYTGFTPVIGTILPCGLQKNKRYTFKGIISAKLNPKLILHPGVCFGEKFFVPGRPFSKSLKPEVISSLTAVPETDFFAFEYSFVADGKAKYLTFGTFTEEDTVGAKKKLFGTQTVSLVLDNFQLIPEDPTETFCRDYLLNKENIYEYNYRHKEMDYSLYGKGHLDIEFNDIENRYITAIKEPTPIPKADTLKLGDVFFDFNKADLKPTALTMLANYFVENKSGGQIDSLYIEGHTDSIGTDQRNLQLSGQRCESVKNWLQLNNIVTETPYSVHPFGRSRPVATNKTPAGRALNRRVEIIIFRKAKS